jgi:hypothetical protein
VYDGIEKEKCSVMTYSSVQRFVWEREKKQNKEAKIDTKKKNQSRNEMKKQRKQ